MNKRALTTRTADPLQVHDSKIYQDNQQLLDFLRFDIEAVG